MHNKTGDGREVDGSYRFVTVFPLSSICSLVVNCVKNFVAVNESAIWNVDK